MTNPVVDNIYNTDAFINMENVKNGNIVIERKKQPKDSYTAGSSSDGGQSKRNQLNQDDLFPTLNSKYQLNKKNSLRLAVSRTVTRPSFVELQLVLDGLAQFFGGSEEDVGASHSIERLRRDMATKCLN